MRFEKPKEEAIGMVEIDWNELKNSIITGITQDLTSNFSRFK